MRLRAFTAFVLVIAAVTALVGCRSTTVSTPRKPVTSSGDLEWVQQLPEPSVDHRVKAHAHYGAGVIHDVNSEPDEALKEYLLAAKLDPANESLILEVSRRLLQAKQQDKALEIVSRAAALPGASGAIFARLGVIYGQLGRNQDSMRANRTAIKKSPTAINGYQNLFLNYLQEKQPQEAINVLDNAGKQPNASAEFLIGLGELYATLAVQAPALRDDARKKGVQALVRAEKLKPSSPPLKLMLADHLNALGDSKHATQIYLEVLQALPDVPALRERVHAKLTEIYLENQNHKAATEQLQAIVRDDPTNPMVYYYLGTLAAQDKRPDDAVDYLSKAIVLKSDFEQVYYELANVQIGAGKDSEALATLEKARQKFPNNFVLEALTGSAYTHQKAYKEALQHLTSAEIIAKTSEQARLTHLFYFQLGAAYERTGDYEQAQKYFENALRLSPDFTEAMNYLGYMWAEHGVNLEKARELIEKAVKAEPENSAFLDSLGWVLFKLKQPREALEPMLKAIKTSEEPDATLYDHLGDIYSSLNERGKAHEAWRKSLSIEANEVVRKKLDSGEGR